MKAAQAMHLSRGDVLFREGEPGDTCYWVLKGTLKVGVSSAKGEERIFALLGPGSVVGELTVLDRRPRSATVTAVSDANLTALTRATLIAYLRIHPSVYADLIEILVGRLRKADEELTADTFLTVQARVARALLSLVDQVGEPNGSNSFVLPATVSHRDIGAMAGVARESVSRAVSEWRRRGIITRAPGKRLGVEKSKLEKEAR
jgi:CRP/FNR family transcriptional regulator